MTTSTRALRRSLAWIAAVVVLGVATQARAQTAEKTDWRHGTTLAGFVGAASTESRSDLAAGGAIGWEFTPHFTVEGRGFWLAAGRGADAFAALLGARMPILADRPVVPFVSAGVGVFRSMFDTAPERIPRFYQGRMAPMDPLAWRPRTFDDFVMSFGGGADLYLARHLAFRPEVSLLLVTTRSDVHAVPVFGAQLAYHFESHPITPGRAPSAAPGTR
jgi:hypothetical protein